MQKEIGAIQAGLYYELTSSVYREGINKDVYLNFIDYSNMDYYTSVKKKGVVVIPLLVFNYSKQTYRVALGENSLEQNYREFLTDALLAECNSSTCFNLIDNSEGTASDSALVLDVKITHNKTFSKIKLTDSAFIGFNMLLGGGDDFDYYSSNKVEPAVTQLKLMVELKQKGRVLHKKEYEVTQSCNFAGGGYGESFHANEACVRNMATSLSLATKEIVEEISKELHLLLY